MTITYNDGSTETISLTNENVKVTGFDNTKSGKITLTVEYAGNKTAFDIKIISENINGSDNNKEEDNADDTLAEGVLPNAGGKNIIFIVISLILIISVIFNKKYRKYKDIYIDK